MKIKTNHHQKTLLISLSFLLFLFSFSHIIHTINAATVPQESSHSNTNTYTNLNTITNTQDITFTINYNTAGNITWYKDGAPIKTDTAVTTSTVTTAWTSADYGQVKEMRVNSTTVDGTSTDTIWNVEVQETGTATITKNTHPYFPPTIDYQNTLYATNGWVNLPTLYLFAKQSDNAWVEYVKAKTYLIKAPILVEGATLYLKSDTVSEVRMQGISSSPSYYTKIQVSNNGTLEIDKVQFYGWNIANDTEITVNDSSPIIISDGSNQMDITNSSFRHVRVWYKGDKSPGDVVYNNIFFEGNPTAMYVLDPNNPINGGSQGQTISNNAFINSKTNNFYADGAWDTSGIVLQNNKFIFPYNSATVSENVLLGEGTKFVGNEVSYSSWNMVEYPPNGFSKYNNLHDNGGHHNGFNNIWDYSYSVNDYCHDFTGGYNCFYIQVQTWGGNGVPSTWDWPHDIYLFNSYGEDGAGINILGGSNIYAYNYTSNDSGVSAEYSSDHIVIRKSNFLKAAESGILLSDKYVDDYGYVGNVYVIDSVFTEQNREDYRISSEPAYGGNPIIHSINSFRKNRSSGAITIPVFKTYADTTWNGEVRNYVYLDALVQDQSGNPISNATITIAPLADTDYPAIKTLLPPSPPDLEEHPTENLPIPSVVNFDSTQTGANGHTLLPNYGWSNNIEATPALLFYRQKSGNVDFTNYSYRITATLGGSTVSKTITPDISWYREDPTQPSKTVVLTFNKEAGKSALNVNSGSGSGIYTPAQVVNIAANSAPFGKVFDKWIGDTTGITNTSSNSTTITIQSSDASITPYYKDITYHLTVIGGTGSGDYPAGKITVADAAPTNSTQVFYQWTGNGADHVVSPTVYSSTLIMPNHDITVTATYRNPVSYACHLTVANGTGTDFYAPGDDVSISAQTPTSDKVFDHWEGDTDNLSSLSSSTPTLNNIPDRYLIIYPVYIDSGITATPTFSPQGNTYPAAQTITISSATTAATIHYTTDNTDPTAASPTYSNPILISATTTFKAIALKQGYTDSAISSATYTITGTVATPTFSIQAGAYTSTQTVSLTTSTSGATIHYTTNGSTPTASSPGYTSPLTVSSTTTIKAMAIKTGYTNSAVATATYTINIPSSGGGGGGGSSSGGSSGGSTSSTPTILKTEIKSITGNTVVLTLSVTNATHMLLSDSPTFTNSSWQSYSPTPTYIKKDQQTKLYLKFKSSSNTISPIVTLTIPTTPITPLPPTPDTPYPTGTLLKLATSPKVYVIIDNKKKWISTPEVFQQLGYQWTNILTLTPTQLNQFPDYEDNLIRQRGDYKVYLVVNGVKRHIPNPIIFLDYGFKWNEVKDVPQETIDKYKPTYLIKQSGSNGIYYVNPQEIRKLIPSTEVFNSYNDKQEDIQIISKTEMDFYPLSNLIKLGGSNDIYLIEGNVKKRIPNPTVFNKYKLNWNLVMSVNQTEFNFYQDGGELK